MAFVQRPSPQFEVRRIASRPAIDLFLTPDRILLADAVDRFGKHEYPTAWTGEELLARSHLVKPAGIQRRDFPGMISSIASSRKGQPPRTVWMVETRWGVVSYDALERAEEVWSKEKERIHAQYEAELAARDRFKSVVLTIRGRLATGEWKSFVLDRQYGYEYAIPITYWRSDGGGQVFELQDDIAKWRNPNFVSLYVPSGTYNPSIKVQGNVIFPLDQLPTPGEARGHLPPRPLSETEAQHLFQLQQVPVRSPIDGSLYYTWEAYRDHLCDHSATVLRPSASAAEFDSMAPASAEPKDTLAYDAAADDGNVSGGKAIIKAESRCKRWLDDQMRQSPSPQKAKAAYRTDAKTKFPGLSNRAFDRAWAGAVEATGATDWAAPGRRQQS